MNFKAEANCRHAFGYYNFCTLSSYSLYETTAGYSTNMLVFYLSHHIHLDDYAVA